MPDATWNGPPEPMADPSRVSDRFPRYNRFDPQVPVWGLTPNLRGCLHRFFDTSPISPSGRYAAVLQLPDEGRLNRPGDVAHILLIDLLGGETRVVAQTRGWEPQMGANLNWGDSDRALVFNDVDTTTWSPQLVRLDPHTGRAERTPGGVYHVSPNGRFAAAPSLERMRRTQFGYGVVLPDHRVPVNIGAPDDDGLFITDLATGERRLVLPLREAAKAIPDLAGARLDDWQVYGFHCKWSPDGSRLIFSIRRFLRTHAVSWPRWKRWACRLARPSAIDRAAWDNIARGVLRYDVLTCRPDGSDVHNAVPAHRWAHGGHHVNWCPDSEHLSMNLAGDRGQLQLMRVRYDGEDLAPIVVGAPGVPGIPGSGHPTVHPCGHVLADTYADERPLAYDDGSVPLRWINPSTGGERELVRVPSRVTPTAHAALRVDAHPAWDRSWRRVVFNGVADNTRHVYLADLTEVVAEAMQLPEGDRADTGSRPHAA